MDKAVRKSRCPSVPPRGACLAVLKLVCLQPFLSKPSLGSFSLAHEPLLLLQTPAIQQVAGDNLCGDISTGVGTERQALHPE